MYTRLQASSLAKWWVGRESAGPKEVETVMVEGETPALWPGGGGMSARGGELGSGEEGGTYGVGENRIFEGGRPKPLMMKSDCCYVLVLVSTACRVLNFAHSTRWNVPLSGEKRRTLRRM